MLDAIKCPSLFYDQACLNIFSAAEDVSLWGQATDCYLCDLTNLVNITSNSYNSVIIDTTYKYNLSLKNSSDKFICNLTGVSFKNFGIYGWNSTNTSCSQVYSVSLPDNEFEPFVLGILLILTLLVCWHSATVCYIHGSFCQLCNRSNTTEEIRNDLGTTSQNSRSNVTVVPKQNTQSRIVSLDAFRGIAISLMIFVNYGGGGYWFFEHSAWNGVTIGDFVFPWFAWIMGVSIATKVRSELRKGTTRKNLLFWVVRRSATLILIGIILTNIGMNDLRYIRLPGVLQRLGLSFLFVAAIETYLMNPQRSIQNIRLQSIEDIADCWLQWLIIGFVVAIHTAVTFFMPLTPDCPTGYIGPGGMHNHNMQFNCTGGAAGYIDRFVFGQNHIYQRPTCQRLYKSVIPFDPEGLLGTLTTILCVYLGVQAGHTLLIFKSTQTRIKRWMLWATIMIILAGILSGFSVNEGIVPLNKNLWSVSYVLATSGCAFILMSILYYLIDHRKLWSGSPFYQPGMNAFLLYMLHILFRQTFPWQWKAFSSSHTEYLLMDIWAVFLWILISVVFHHHQFFITL